MPHKRKSAKKRPKTYRGYIIEKRGPGRRDVDIFKVAPNGAKYYQASGLNLGEATRIIDAMHGD